MGARVPNCPRKIEVCEGRLARPPSGWCPENDAACKRSCPELLLCRPSAMSAFRLPVRHVGSKRTAKTYNPTLIVAGLCSSLALLMRYRTLGHCAGAAWSLRSSATYIAADRGPDHHGLTDPEFARGHRAPSLCRTLSVNRQSPSGGRSSSKPRERLPAS